jgi:hypothetical protein
MYIRNSKVLGSQIMLSANTAANIEIPPISGDFTLWCFRIFGLSTKQYQW